MQWLLILYLTSSNPNISHKWGYSPLWFDNVDECNMEAERIQGMDRRIHGHICVPVSPIPEKTV